jgi:hypothetical protein
MIAIAPSQVLINFWSDCRGEIQPVLVGGSLLLLLPCYHGKK